VVLAWPALLARAEAAGLPVKVNPARAGLDQARLAPLRAELQKMVDRREIAGAVSVIGRRGQIGSFEVVGLRDVEGGKPMQADTIFRIASMSKIATAVAVMVLAEEGKLSVGDAVARHLPEFRGQQLITSRPGDPITLAPPPREITIEDILTHTSGMSCRLPAGFTDLYEKRNRTLAEGVIAFSQQPLISPPGAVWKYCSPAYDSLGRIIEVASGKPLDVFMHERIFRPLGMTDTTFRPAAEQRRRLAIIYRKQDEGGLAPLPGQGFPAENLRWLSPSGGLFSTAADCARLAQMLLQGGALGGHRVLQAATVHSMASVHFTYKEKVAFTPGLGMGLGVQVVMTPTGVTAMLGPGAFGHGGGYGTQLWVDPAHDMFFVLMIQRTGFGNGDMSEVRKTVQEIGVSAIVPAS
jgi:CubicO group peptidase (beta-lactamase class C family)